MVIIFMNKIQVYTGTVIMVLLVFSGIVLEWQFDKDFTSLYRDGDLIAKSKWIVNAERTYINKNTWYRTNVICPRIIDNGGYETATRCYYADDTYEPLSRSLIGTAIDFINQTTSYLVRKSTPNYKYGTRGSYAGYVIEEMTFVDIEQMEEFPNKYTVNWSPKDTRNYKLVWKIENLKQINLPDGEYHNCNYQFGKIKIDLKDDCNKLEKAEIIDQSKIYFYFNNERGEQLFDLTLVDPTVAPNKPTLNFPPDNSTGQRLLVTLNVTVTDDDADNMNVSFYDGTTFSDTGSGNLTFTSAGSKIKNVSIHKDVTIDSATLDLKGYLLNEGTYYDNFSIAVSLQNPYGITQNGTSMWVSGFGITSLTIEYDLNGNYLSNFSGHGTGIAQNGTHFFFVVYTIPEIDIYTIDGTDTTTYLSLNATNDNPRGIDCNGTHLFVSQYATAEIYVYTIGGVYTDWYDLSATGSGNGHIGSVVVDDDYLWTTDWLDDKIYKYYINGTYISSFDVSSSPYGLEQTEDYFYVVDEGVSKIFRYLTDSYTTNITIDTGNDGSIDYENISTFNGSVNDIDLNITALQNCVDTCANPSGDNCICEINFTSQTAGILEYSDINIEYGALGSATNISNGSYATYEWSGLKQLTTYEWYAIVTDGILTNISDTWNFTTDASGINLTLEGFTKNITAELGSLINVTAIHNISGLACVDIDHPDYGTNYSCETNSTEFDLNITYFRQDNFNDSTTSQVLTNTGQIGITMDNRSELLDTQLDVTSSGTTSGLSIDYGSEGESFNGELQGNKLINTEFKYGDILYNATNITFSSAASKYIYLNMTEHPISISFQLWGSDLDAGNDFSFTDYFENSTYIDNSSSTSEYPLWTWDDFSTDTRTDIYTTGTGTHSEGIDITDSRLESSCSTSVTCYPDPSDDTAESTSKVISLLQNISRFKKIEFNAYMYAYAKCGAGSGESYSYSSEHAYIVISNSPTFTSSTGISSVSESVSCDGYFTGGEFDDDSSSKTKTITLIRNEDSGTSFTFDIYENAVYTGTTSSLSGDINIGMKTASEIYCDNVNSNSWASGNSNAYIDTIKYSGVANNYTGNITYITNSTFESEILNITANDIEVATLTVSSIIPSFCTTDYFLSNNNGTDWEEVSTGVRHVFTSVGKVLKWKSDLNCTETSDTPVIFEMKTEIISSSTSNISIDLGSNGDTDWTYNNTLNSTTSPQNVSLSLTDGTKNSDYGIKITSGSSGIILINNSIFNSSINPIELDEDEFENCDDCKINFTFSGDNITVDGLQVDYKGGNKTYTVLAHDSSYSNNQSYDITYYYSKWDYNLPSNIDNIYFYPWGPTATSVEPFGQSSSIPIMNITSEAYDGPGINFSVLLNQTHSCVNMTIQPNSTKVSDNVMTNYTWTTMKSNLAEGSSFGLWMWVDMNCNYLNWQTWEPIRYYRACCVGCTICNEDLV